jgi:transposase InsO family protein
MALAAHVKKEGYYLVPRIHLKNKHRRWREQTKKIGLSKEAKTRLEWFIYYETRGGHNASRTARHFGIAPKTFYKWRTAFDEKNLRTLESASRAPRRVREKQITPHEEERVVMLRREHIRWGKLKLKNVYERRFGETISSWKIQYTIQKYNLYYNPAKNARTQAKKKRSKAKKRITELTKQPVPGFLIALDTIIIHWNGVKRYILTAIDETSKLAFARMYTSKSSRNAKDFLKRVMYVMDYECWNTCHDNGSEFEKEFQDAVTELKLDQYWSRNGTPTDNPVNERFNRTFQEEFIQLGNFSPDPAVFNRRATEWLIEYAFERPHQSLDYATPWEYYEKANKLLPMWSSSTAVCASVGVC